MRNRQRYFCRMILSSLLACLFFVLPACSGAPSQSGPPVGQAEAGSVSSAGQYVFMQRPDEDRILSSGYSIADYIYTDCESLSDMANLIVTGKYLGDIDSFADSSGMIYTKALFEVQDTLKGIWQNKTIEVTYAGGVVPLNEFMASLTEDRIEKYGYDTIPEAERSSLYIERKVEDGAQPVVGDSYLVLLSQAAGENTLLSDGFGLLKMQDGKAYDYATNSDKTFSFME